MEFRGIVVGLYLGNSTLYLSLGAVSNSDVGGHGFPLFLANIAFQENIAFHENIIYVYIFSLHIIILT